jgi:2-polyprenyl-6-methoxyphenol hydroxylase-like FAD-dependent oxidoreductase
MSLALDTIAPVHNEPPFERTLAAGRNRAIVVGGSMAGLAAVRVLSDHYRQVILVERDHLEKLHGHRRGVPQNGHAHGLFASGREIWEGFFPGLVEDVLRAGAVKADITRDAHWCFETGEQARFESGLDAVLVSRPLLKGMVRRRVRDLSNVLFLDGRQVKGLATDSSNRRVIGVQVEGGGLLADLIVDATGRGSRSPQWLEKMRYEPPKQERIEVNLTYATRNFRRAGHHLNGALLASIAATPEISRGGFLLAQEGNRWSVTLTCYGGQVPTELSAFIDFAKTLPASYISDVISQAEPLDEAQSARFPTSVRNRYELMDRLPEGFLVVGDAICSFNPVYGQGMSVAALHAVELDKALRANSTNLAQSFFTQAARVVDTAWSVAAGNDLRMPGVAGPRTLISRFLNWYVAEFQINAQTDTTMAIAFQNATNLLASPQSLLKPGLAARVLSAAFSRHAARNRAVRLEATANGAF